MGNLGDISCPSQRCQAISKCRALSCSRTCICTRTLVLHAYATESILTLALRVSKMKQQVECFLSQSQIHRRSTPKSNIMHLRPNIPTRCRYYLSCVQPKHSIVFFLRRAEDVCFRHLPRAHVAGASLWRYFLPLSEPWLLRSKPRIRLNDHGQTKSFQHTYSCSISASLQQHTEPKQRQG